MATRMSSWRNTLGKTLFSSKAISNSSNISLPVDITIEEEMLPYYETQQFYPVHIGDVFKDRYQVAGKLGYGADSTSWLCRDFQSVAETNLGQLFR